MPTFRFIADIKRLNSLEIKSSITKPFTDNRLLFSLFESITRLNEFFKILRDQYTDNIYLC